MANLARINQATGIVENIILPYAPPEGYIEVPVPDGSGVSIGYSYVNGEFIPPQTNQTS